MKKIIRRILNSVGYDVRALSEVEENWFALDRFPNVDVVIDIGVAHSTKVLLKHFPNAKHYLFEPVVDFNDAIKHNYMYVNYELFNLACSDVSGELEIFLDPIFLSNSRVLEVEENQQIHNSLKSFRTNSVRLDDFFVTSDDRISTQKTLLKIDVEGHELEVIKGAEQILESINYIIIEISCQESNNLGNIFEFMLTRGFSETTVLYAHRWENKYQALDILFTRPNDLN